MICEVVETFNLGMRHLGDGGDSLSFRGDRVLSVDGGDGDRGRATARLQHSVGVN